MQPTITTSEFNVYVFDISAWQQSDGTFLNTFLKGKRRLALDAEWDSTVLRTNPNPRINLVQIAIDHENSTRGTVFLFRTHKEEWLPNELVRVLSNPTITKVMSTVIHPNTQDIRFFRECFGVELSKKRGVVSIGDMARLRNFSRGGLKNMTESLFDVTLENYARADWTKHILSHKEIMYAAQDAWYTLRVYRELQKRPLLRNNASRATVEEKVIAEGTFRRVYKGKYVVGPRAGEPCVAKRFKSGCVYEASYFANDELVTTTAALILQAFNACQPIDCKRFYLNQPTIWIGQGTNEKVLIEPFIENFRKFNSNTGGSVNNEYVDVLSHFSYHHSNGRLLLCDVQGTMKHDCYELTDPVIMSVDKRYGPTDLGERGIRQFFAHHTCTDWCSHYRKPPNIRPFEARAFMVTMNTSFTR
ncbi:hypothetical protein HK102_001365 [Quaeritorhiza haematococci]|nr:hypothetical protein HK102_001365 [Quaeritorhiza haematococci]